MTERQSDVLARFKRGESAKDIANALGITESGVYQHKRNFIQQGLLPKGRRQSGAKKQSRGLSSATAMRRDPSGENGSRNYFRVTASTAAGVGVDAAVDPVTVIASRIRIVKEAVLERSDAVENAIAVLGQATGDLESLGAEAHRLEKALKILAPSSNGRRKNAKRRSRTTASSQPTTQRS